MRSQLWHVHAPALTPRSALSCLRQLTSQPAAPQAPRDLFRTQAGGHVNHVNMDLTNITRTNFREALPHIRAALQECRFFAFDLEMTGLFLDHHRDEYLDEPQDRWARMRESAGAYLITQFGLSCFKLLPDGNYQATTFNAYIFPEPPSSEAVGNIQPRRFLVDAGALSFLARHNFDFNRWVGEGVPYMPIRMHDEKLQQAARTERDAPRNDVALDKPQDQATVAKIVDEVCSWLSGTDADMELAWLNTGYQRLLAYQELAKPRDWQQGGAYRTDVVDPQSYDPGFYVTKTIVDGWPRIRLVRGSKADAAAAEAAQQAARQALLEEAAGFSDVLRAMRECGKPAVGHNPYFDVAYIIATFCHGIDLPPVFADFKSLVDRWFPGGMYDTKHLISYLPEDLAQAVAPQGTALGSLFSCITAEGPARAAAAARLTQPQQQLPSISHAPGSTRYDGVPAGGAAHEAGYDAYMTGAVFACLERLLAAQGNATAMRTDTDTDTDTSSDTPMGDLGHVTQYRGRINVSRSDMPYIALSGPDPPLSREHVFHVQPTGTLGEPLQNTLSAVGCRARVSGAHPGVGGYLIQLEGQQPTAWQPSQLQAALQQHAPTVGWLVRPWREYSGDKAAVVAAQIQTDAANGVGAKRRRTQPAPANGAGTRAAAGADQHAGDNSEPMSALERISRCVIS